MSKKFNLQAVIIELNKCLYYPIDIKKFNQIVCNNKKDLKEILNCLQYSLLEHLPDIMSFKNDIAVRYIGCDLWSSLKINLANEGLIDMDLATY